MSTQTEIRARITAEVVAALETGGLPPWRCPWAASGPPANAATGRRYSGVNVLLLHIHRQRLGLAGPSRYATFNQWQEVGCRVKPRPADVPPGRWGCAVVLCKAVERKPRDGEADERRGEYLLLRTFTVFNVDQVEGEAADRLRAGHAPQRAAFADYAPAESAVAATGADIRHGSDRAFYLRPTPEGVGDFIAVPHKHAFESEKEYYATLLHELGHWTECRLNWTGSYAEGELRAEMASAFALADLGVPQSDDLTTHNSYLASWLAALRADPRFLFRVSADASRAVDFLLSFSRRKQPEPAEPVAV